MRYLYTLVVLCLLAACQQPEYPFDIEPIAAFDEPWAMAFLPDGRLLVTEQRGTLHVVTQAGDVSPPIGNVPAVDHELHCGLGDVAPHPDYADNQTIYLS